MPIRNSFDVDECLSSQVWLVVVSLNGSHAVLVQVLHAIWDSVAVILVFFVVDVEPFVMFEEALEFFKLIACLRFGVRSVVLTWSELRHHIDHIIQAKLAHIIIIAHSVLYNLYLDLQHRQSVHSDQLDVI